MNNKKSLSGCDHFNFFSNWFIWFENNIFSLLKTLNVKKCNIYVGLDSI